MPDLGAYTKNADIVVLAGANANATAITTAETDKYVLMVEAMINDETGRNWSDLYASLNTDMGEILSLCGAAKCAQIVINYDLNSWNLATAQTKLNVLQNIYEECIKILIEKNKAQAFMGAP